MQVMYGHRSTLVNESSDVNPASRSLVVSARLVSVGRPVGDAGTRDEPLAPTHA